MRRQFLSVCVLFFIGVSAFVVGCAGNKSQEARTSEYIENYISQLKDIEVPAYQKWTVLMRIMEQADEAPSEDFMFSMRDAISETIEANRQAMEELRILAARPAPEFIDDTIRIFLRTATGLLGQSYEMRNEAITWFNRYVSLGTARFFDEYRKRMVQAMEHSRQSFFFLTMARVRYRVAVGDTLDMTVREFLGIAEHTQLPPEAFEQDIRDEEIRSENANTD